MHFSIKELFTDRKKTSGATKQINDFIKRKKAFIQNQADADTTYAKLKAEEHAVFVDFIRELITEKEISCCPFFNNSYRLIIIQDLQLCRI